MSLSIIIPTLNEAQGIGYFLKKLQPLRHQQCELIVADGGSIDATKKIATPLVDCFIDTRKGRAKQMNAGANLANNEVLLFLHADTYLPDDALNQIANGLSAGFVWGRFNIRLTGTHPMLKVVAFMMNWRSRISGIATGDQAIFVAKQAFDKVGHYPEIALMEDISLCQKLKKIGKPFCISTKVTSSGRRWQQFGIYKTILLMWWLRGGYRLGRSPEQLSYLYTRGQFWKH